MLAVLADELGVTRNQVVLAWLVGSDPSAVPIVGMSSPAQLDEALGISAVTLTDDQHHRLNTPA